MSNMNLVELGKQLINMGIDERFNNFKQILNKWHKKLSPNMFLIDLDGQVLNNIVMEKDLIKSGNKPLGTRTNNPISKVITKIFFKHIFDTPELRQCVCQIEMHIAKKMSQLPVVDSDKDSYNLISKLNSCNSKLRFFINYDYWHNDDDHFGVRWYSPYTDNQLRNTSNNRLIKKVRPLTNNNINKMLKKLYIILGNDKDKYFKF